MIDRAAALISDAMNVILHSHQFTLTEPFAPESLGEGGGRNSVDLTEHKKSIWSNARKPGFTGAIWCQLALIADSLSISDHNTTLEVEEGEIVFLKY